jgi:elongation factor Ts
MTQDGYGVIIEMNSETDFVARNQDFQDLVQEVLSTAVSHKVDALEPLLSTVFGKDTLKERILEIAGKVGENLILRRISFLSVDPGVVVSYIHSPSGTGRVGVLLALNSGADPKELYALGKKIAMHIAASNPVYIRSSEVPVEVIARERAVLSEQAASSGRPEAVIEKMVEGRLQKFFSEIALEEQDFICEPGKKVKEILQDEEKKLGTSIQVTGMVRYALGGAS